MSWSARDEAGAREFFDSKEEVRAKVADIARRLRTSRHAIIFTGAGLSTSAGIPDFRSGLSTKLKTGPGLWAAQADYERRNPVRTEATKNDPARPTVNLDKFLTVGPTYSHRAIAKLVAAGMVKTVLTQNVDNLHRRAGVAQDDIVELHGNLQVERCDICGRDFERDFRIGPNPGKEHYTGRRCEVPGCRGWLKDYLVPFGEDLAKLRRKLSNVLESFWEGAVRDVPRRAEQPLQRGQVLQEALRAQEPLLEPPVFVESVGRVDELFGFGLALALQVAGVVMLAVGSGASAGGEAEVGSGMEE